MAINWPSVRTAMMSSIGWQNGNREYKIVAGLRSTPTSWQCYEPQIAIFDWKQAIEISKRSVRVAMGQSGHSQFERILSGMALSLCSSFDFLVRVDRVTQLQLVAR